MSGENYEIVLEETLNNVWAECEIHLKTLKIYIENNFLKEKIKDGKYEKYKSINDLSQRISSIYELCISDNCIFYEPKLYERFKLHVKNYLDTLLPRVIEKGGEEMLKYTFRLWKAFKDVYVKYCLKLCKHLDMYYVKNDNKPGLREISHQVFRINIYDRISDKLVPMLLGRVKKDRDDGILDFRNMIKDGVIMLREMDISAYVDTFEVELIKETRIFYKKKRHEWMEDSNIMKYFRSAKERIDKEDTMLKSLFPPDTQQKLRKIMLYELLVCDQKNLIGGKEFRKLLRENMYPELSLIFSLMKLLEIEKGIIPLAEILKEYILSVGKEIHEKHLNSVKSLDSHHKMVELLINQYCDELIELKERLIELITIPFKKDSEMVRVFHSAFYEFVNLSFKREKNQAVEIFAPQIFAYYCDKKIRKNVEELENKLKKVVDFIQFFKEKDMFIMEYKKQLKERLLTHQKEEEEERSIISMIKIKYRGISQIYKLERMLKDKIASREMKEEYRIFLEKYNKEQRELHDKKKMSDNDDDEEEEDKNNNNNLSLIDRCEVTVLTQGSWPISMENEKLIPPKEILSAQETYSVWYKKKFEDNRKLQWSYENSSCHVQALYKHGKKMLDISTYQTAIILLYNNRNQGFSIDQITEFTNIRGTLLNHCLYAFIQYKILRIKRDKKKKKVKKEYNDKDKDVKMEKKKDEKKTIWWKDPTTVLILNTNFKSKKHMIKAPFKRFTESRTLQTQKSLSKDREMVIDAAIVRIMKARRKFSWTNIYHETIKQIHVFVPTVKQMKRRIEQLIEQEYLVRDDKDHKMINYVA